MDRPLFYVADLSLAGWLAIVPSYKADPVAACGVVKESDDKVVP